MKKALLKNTVKALLYAIPFSLVNTYGNISKHHGTYFTTSGLRVWGEIYILSFVFVFVVLQVLLLLFGAPESRTNKAQS